MPDPALQQARDIPSFKVLVGGRELPNDAAVDLMEVRVSTYVEGASTFTITFNNWHADRQEFKWVDETLLGEGADVEIKAGFGDTLTSLIVGEVTALEPDYPEGEAPTLRVVGYDALHRFRRGRRTRAFNKMKDSEIAQKIAGDLGLSIQAEDTQTVHEFVLQDNQTDIDFLLMRARPIGFEVLAQGGTLYFRKVANSKSKLVSLEYGLTLRSFYPRLSTARQVSEVVVQGWDAKNKQAISGKAGPSDVGSKMGGQKLGASIAEQAFSKTTAFYVDKTISSAGEATQMARGRFGDLAMDFVTGEGTAVGSPEIRAGEVIELRKLGQRFSGLYYVTSATHFVTQAGFTTRFTVARNST